MQSFKETIEKIKSKEMIQNRSKISLILFNHKARLMCENVKPNEMSTDLKMIGGGTNFEEPFGMAA